MLAYDPAELFWLPQPAGQWRDALGVALEDETGRALRGFCSSRLGTSQLRSARARIEAAVAAGNPLSSLRSMRIGLLGSGTLDYLAEAIPGTAPRHGIAATVAPVIYDSLSLAAAGRIDFAGRVDCAAIMPDLRNFVRPQSLLDADGHGSAIASAIRSLEQTIARLREGNCGSIVLATVAGHPDTQLGSSDLGLWGSDRRFLADINARIADLAEREGAVLWDIDALASAVGLRAWRDPVSANLAKSPFAIDLTPLVADRLCAVLSGLVGKGRRALVLDLDNTCWGGVIGDDGLEGIVLGQGDPAGEAHVSLQRYALDMRARGIVLCVCSKNEEVTARQPFRDHPDMLLREEHIAVFQANWQDKASNLKAIAQQLSLDPESLVFVDDNPAERARVRQQLPEVAVPELPEDPAYYRTVVAAGGYFENPALNRDDLARAAAYGGNARRAAIREKLGNYDDYLESLQMVLDVRPFDSLGRSRIAQLINKSNQFNLTTRRRTEAEVAEVEQSADWLGLQFRLTDAFGDNGMISVVIVRFDGADAMIDTWLMSCRVLERGVEQAVLNEVARQAGAKGAARLLGEYVPTARNVLVRDHYAKLGFCEAGPGEAEGATKWALDLAAFCPFDVRIQLSVVRTFGATRGVN